jgi:hypothetical protein
MMPSSDSPSLLTIMTPTRADRRRSASAAMVWVGCTVKTGPRLPANMSANCHEIAPHLAGAAQSFQARAISFNRHSLLKPQCFDHDCPSPRGRGRKPPAGRRRGHSCATGHVTGA